MKRAVCPVCWSLYRWFRHPVLECPACKVALKDEDTYFYEATYAAIGRDWRYAPELTNAVVNRTVYPSLARLEAEGLIESKWEAGRYPRRRLYRRSQLHEPCSCGLWVCPDCRPEYHETKATPESPGAAVTTNSPSGPVDTGQA